MSFERIFPCLIAIVSVLGASMGCSRASTDTTYWSEAIVYGTILDAGGTPVAQATVASKGYRSSCERGTQDADGSPTIVRSDANGSYRQRLVGGAPVEYCIVVTVGPPTGSTLLTVTATGRVLLTSRASPPYDSVRIDVTLR